MTAVFDIPLPLVGIPPGASGPAAPGVAGLRDQIKQAERAEDRLRRQIEDLEEEADGYADRIAECALEIAVLESGSFDAAGFDLRLPLITVRRDVNQAKVQCSVCGTVLDVPVSGYPCRRDPKLFARQHALDAHDGLVDAEGWAR